ncbi:hypothetical protein BZL29_4505 [Mycobacterium kansasii]|uniref:Uncharacterized protein n=1 Tax=Mycobacterium kansasii TaxID=1768 RepID=A0A1V3X6X4_MYCKA|nr:hypothetical protein BZL29_4505 [Mycobacterium kansasii]
MSAGVATTGEGQHRCQRSGKQAQRPEPHRFFPSLASVKD